MKRKLKIAIDLSMVDNRSAGIGQYASSITESLLRNDKKNTFTIFTNNIDNLKTFKEFVGESKNFEIREIKGRGVLWILKVSKLLKSENYDFLLSPSNFLFGILFPNTLQWVHDLAPVKYPKFFKKSSSLMYKLLLDLLLLKGKYIATISETIKEELIKYRPSSRSKLINIGIGIHTWILKDSTSKEKEKVINKFNLPKNFFLIVSTLEPRKNHINTIKGFRAYLDTFENKGEYKLVITGKRGWFYNEIFETVKELKLENDIIFTDYVENLEINALYELCSGVVLLSLYEGFGLSLIEGLIKNKNLLVSDIPIFREVLTLQKKGVVFVNENDRVEISNGFNKLTTMGDLSVSYDYSPYSWDATYTRISSILNSL